MAGREQRRGLVTAMLAVLATTGAVVVAVLAMPSGSPSAVVEAGQELGHEIDASPDLGPTAPSSPTPAFTPEALPEATPTFEEPAPGPGLQSPDTRGVLRLVYFVEADAAVDEGAVELIAAQAEALQLFWYEQFSGTFALPAGGVDVIYGDHPASWYDQMINGEEPRWHRLLNIQEEVSAKLGVGPNDDVRMVVYPATRLDGRVGAIRYAGAWMDGDDISCIDGSTPTVPYAADYPANCLMTVAHELGHVYGLGHQGDDAYCMQFGFYRYVNDQRNCTFSDLSRQLVVNDHRNQGWLAALPGDRR